MANIAQTSLFWFALGAVSMLGGAMAFAWKMSRGNEENRDYYAVLTFIALIAGLAYVAMTTGIGVLTLGNEKFHIARYVDWVITTPLILLLFALLANSNIKEWSVAATLDVLMIVTGAVGTVATGVTKYIWFGISTLMLIALFYYLFGRVTKSAENARPAVRHLFSLLRNYIAAIWVAYPLVWLVSPAALGVTTVLGADIAFTVLDVITKVGIGVIVIRSNEALNDLAERQQQKRARGEPAD